MFSTACGRVTIDAPMSTLRALAPMIAVCGCGIAACGVFTETDGLSGGRTDGGVATDAEAGSEADASEGGAVDASADVASDYRDPGIFCFGQSCAPDAMYCCRNECAMQGTCIDPASTSSCGPTCNESMLRCDSRGDCTATGNDGQVCCLIGLDSNCARASDCAIDPGHHILCDPEDPAACPNGAPCVVDETLHVTIGRRYTCSGG